jgi:hypothetical protein
VLAGDRAADLDAELEDLRAERFRADALRLDVGVVQNERMEVAVARVEHVGAAQVVFVRPVLDSPQHVRERAAGNRAVDAVVVRRDPADGGERRLAADQSSARSRSSLDTRMPVAPAAASTRVISAISAATSSGVPSVSTSSTAAASSGYPAWTNSSTARVAALSIISSPAGRFRRR